MFKIFRIPILVFCWSISFQNIWGQNNQEISTCEITKLVFEKGLEHCDIDFYAGTLMMHGMSEFSLLEGNEEQLGRIISLFEKFGNGEIKAKGNFVSYEAGGSGPAFLTWKGVTGKLEKQVFVAAEKMLNEQKRTPDNLMTAPSLTHEMFIDVVFAVSPFLLYSGLKFNKPEYIDYAVYQTLESFRILKDEKTGLLHQGRGFQGEGKVSEDCWSRGNGWGAFALAILARDLPESHSKRKEVVELAQQFFKNVIKFQNKEGLWNQEMTAPESYVETSGSGLLLHGIGVMLESGLLTKKYRKNFELGLQGITSYIGSDGSVSHCCFSCRCPGKGTKQDYIKHPWVYNDPHAFGPVVLAFAQAAKMGIETVAPLKEQGLYTIADSPEIPRTYVKYARGRDVAWENDRIAFRVFGPEVRNKVGSGVDVWAKSVDYPILEKWYKLNAEGKDYHVDRGEGCDFYDMRKRSGCGALSIWMDDKPYLPQTFDTYRISQNQDNKITFELEYKTWDVPGLEVTERRKMEMEKGTNLFKVTSTLKSKENKEITVAIGLSTFGNPKIVKENQTGILSVWEQIAPAHGNLGTAVLVNPENFAGFESYDGDEFILIKVKTNIPFSYYAGAGWDKSKYFSTQNDWEKYLLFETKKVKF
jgi:rhamnogalacturonyl hydrolase YesR